MKCLVIQETDAQRKIRQRWEVASEVAIQKVKIENFDPDAGDVAIPLMGGLLTASLIDGFMNIKRRRGMTSDERIQLWFDTSTASLAQNQGLNPESMRWEYYRDTQTGETGRVLVGTRSKA